MSPSRLSALLSNVAALAIVVASYLRWNRETWGGPVLKVWARVLLALVALALIAAIALLFVPE